MELVIALLLVLVVVAAVVMLLVNRATAKGSASARDSGGPGIGTDDVTPFGDTPEHSDVDAREGSPERQGGSGRFVAHEDPARVKDQGEAEGASRIR